MSPRRGAGQRPAALPRKGFGTARFSPVMVEIRGSTFSGFCGPRGSRPPTDACTRPARVWAGADIQRADHPAGRRKAPRRREALRPAALPRKGFGIARFSPVMAGIRGFPFSGIYGLRVTPPPTDACARPARVWAGAVVRRADHPLGLRTPPRRRAAPRPAALPRKRFGIARFSEVIAGDSRFLIFRNLRPAAHPAAERCVHAPGARVGRRWRPAGRSSSRTPPPDDVPCSPAARVSAPRVDAGEGVPHRRGPRQPPCGGTCAVPPFPGYRRHSVLPFSGIATRTRGEVLPRARKPSADLAETARAAPRVARGVRPPSRQGPRSRRGRARHCARGREPGAHGAILTF
mgnify:CR=1 FL=1